MTQTARAPRTMPRLTLAGVFGGLFAGYLGLSSVIPVLPVFARDRLHAADFLVGLVVTATALTALLTRPVAGNLADRFGYRRVMRAGALIAGGGALLYFLPLGTGVLIVIRLLLGTGEASLFTAGAAWTVSLAPHERRGQLIGLYGVSMWGGISLGTAIGAALAHLGYDAVWAFSAAAPLAGLALISAVPDPRAAAGAAGEGRVPAAGEGRVPAAGEGRVPAAGEGWVPAAEAAELPAEPAVAASGMLGAPGGPAGSRPRAAAGGARARARRWEALLPRPVVLPGTALALAAAGYSGLAAFVILMLKARGVGAGVVVLTAFSAVYAGTRLFIGHLPDKLGPRRVAAWCGFGEAAGLLIIAAAPDLAVAVAGAVVMGVGFSLLHPSLALMVMNRTDRSRQGVALGAYTSFWDLGIGVWGPLTGVIAAGLGYPAVFVAGAGCAAAASLLALWIDRPAARPQVAVAVAGARE